MNTVLSIDTDDITNRQTASQGNLDNEDTEDRSAILRAAPMATLLMVPSSSNAQRLEDALLDRTLEAEQQLSPRQRARPKTALGNLRTAISAFAADLIRHSAWQPSRGFCYHSKRPDSFSDTVVTRRQFEALVKTWQVMGFIDVENGFQGTSYFDGEPIRDKGWATRYRARADLIAFAADFGITPSAISEHYTEERGLIFPIVLRAKKKSSRRSKSQGAKMKIDKACPTTQRLAAEVTEINASLDRFTFNLETAPNFRRIFNNGDQPDFNWDQGGRLYANHKDSYQQKGSDVRSCITINGEPTVELDIRSSQLTIAYGLLQEPLPHGDLYAILELPREIVKGLVTAIIGKGSLPKRWPKRMAEDYLESRGRKIGKDFKLGECLDLVIQKHPLLTRLEDSGLDVFRLQYVESQILLTAMLRLLRESEIPSLPVHDCLIVRARDKEVTKQVLEEAFLNEVGIKPTITEK